MTIAGGVAPTSTSSRYTDPRAPCGVAVIVRFVFECRCVGTVLQALETGCSVPVCGTMPVCGRCRVVCLESERHTWHGPIVAVLVSPHPVASRDCAHRHQWRLQMSHGRPRLRIACRYIPRHSS